MLDSDRVKNFQIGLRQKGPDSEPWKQDLCNAGTVGTKSEKTDPESEFTKSVGTTTLTVTNCHKFSGPSTSGAGSLHETLLPVCQATPGVCHTGPVPLERGGPGMPRKGTEKGSSHGVRSRTGE